MPFGRWARAPRARLAVERARPRCLSTGLKHCRAKFDGSVGPSCVAWLRCRHRGHSHVVPVDTADQQRPQARLDHSQRGRGHPGLHIGILLMIMLLHQPQMTFHGSIRPTEALPAGTERSRGGGTYTIFGRATMRPGAHHCEPGKSTSTNRKLHTIVRKKSGTSSHKSFRRRLICCCCRYRVGVEHETASGMISVIPRRRTQAPPPKVSPFPNLIMVSTLI